MRLVAVHDSSTVKHVCCGTRVLNMEDNLDRMAHSLLALLVCNLISLISMGYD